MSINLVVTCDSLKRPLTGIGYYTAHLLRELLMDKEFDQLDGLGLKGFIGREALSALLDELMPEAEQPNAAANGRIIRPLISTAKNLADAVPGLSMALRNLYLQRSSRLLRGKRSGWLLHAPNYIPPPYPGPTVITVHDLSHIRHPHTHPAERIRWLNQHFPRSIEQASKIICVSEFTRQEMLDLGLVKDAEKLSVCYNGCEPGFRPRTAEEIAPLLSRWHLEPGRYILSVATLEPRKNLERLIAAYKALPVDIAADYPLVLSGSPGWKHQELAQLISQIKLPHRVVVTGYLNRNGLQELMSGAGLFAYLSIYEGFGLPVIEAMASGAPVLTSNSTSLKEVAGECGYTVDPENCEAISSAMAALLCNDDLSASLRDLGLQRATAFSWQRCARQTIDVYKNVLAGNTPQQV